MSQSDSSSHQGTTAPPTMSEQRIAEIEARSGAITRGQWRWHWRKDDGNAPGGVYAEPFPGHAYAVAMCPKFATRSQFAADADFIANAPADIAWLLAELREVRKDREAFVEGKVWQGGGLRTRWHVEGHTTSDDPEDAQDPAYLIDYPTADAALDAYRASRSDSPND